MIITLTGSNSFMLGQALKTIKDSFVTDHGDLGYEKLDGEESSAERLIEAAQSLPFLAPKKLVVLRSPGVQKQFAEHLETILKSIPQTTDLIIVEPKLDKRSVYFKVLKSNTDFREYGTIDTNKLSNWIVQYAKNNQGQIKPADAAYLIERVGSNQQQLANEVEKLLLYKPTIDRSSIDLLTEPTPQSTIFELLDSAFDGDIRKVNKLYKEQRALKVEPQQIIAMLAWQLHVLAVVKVAGDRSPDQIAKETGISPFVVRKTMKIASKTTMAKTRELIARALKLDISLKTKNINADDALLEYLLTISS